ALTLPSYQISFSSRLDGYCDLHASPTRRSSDLIETSPANDEAPSTPSGPQCDATGSGRRSRQESARATVATMTTSGTTSVTSVVAARRGTGVAVRPGAVAGAGVIAGPP